MNFHFFTAPLKNKADESKTVLLELRLGGFNQRGKALCVIDSQLGQHLAVQINARTLKAKHELTVGQAVETCRSVDAGNPDTAELALALTAACICRCQRTHHRLLGYAILLGTRASVTLGQF